MANLIADHIKGDTWNGFSVTLKRKTSPSDPTLIPIDLTGCSIISQFKTTPKGGVVFEFKTSDNTITIPTPANGRFVYMPRPSFNYPANTYVFDWQVTYPNGTIVTNGNDKNNNNFYFAINQDVSS
jgi:hypothetical protein